MGQWQQSGNAIRLSRAASPRKCEAQPRLPNRPGITLRSTHKTQLRTRRANTKNFQGLLQNLEVGDSALSGLGNQPAAFLYTKRLQRA